MSSNLPPGVTDADIERQAGGESLLEAYERYLNREGKRQGSVEWYGGYKTPLDTQMLDHIYNYSAIPDLAEFVERAMHWAYEEGVKEVERR